MGKYTAICELRGRAPLGKGCTALASTPNYCVLRNKPRTTGYCTSIGVNIDDLFDIGQGDLFGTINMSLFASGDVFLRPAVLLSGVVQPRIDATGTITALMLALAGNSAASITASGTVSRAQALAGTAQMTVVATGAAQVGNTLTGNVPLSIAASGVFTQTVLLSGTAAMAVASSGTVSASKALSGTATESITAMGEATYAGGGGTSRPYTLGDASTPPSIWGDMQATSTVTYDSTTKRISSVASKGTLGGAFAPTATGNAPLYDATAFSGVYPTATFNSAEPDYLLINVNGPAQPATVVYVWQEGASWKSYEVFADHDTNVSGNRQTLFSAYGGNTPPYLVRTVAGSETQVNLQGGPQTANRVNILIVEYNGASSRIYFNGVTTSVNLGAVLSATGIAIGGKKGDSATYFGGKMGELATIPAIFTGDAWDRVTQGTMWKWGQQANIAAGSTYKDAPPMVTT